MKTKNLAMLISENREFWASFSSRLKNYDFEVIKVKGFEDWNLKRHLYVFDLCLVDNRSGNFPFKNFIDYVGRYSPQSVIINVCNNHKIGQFANNFFYEGTEESIDLESFFANLGMYYKRAKARTDLAAMLIHDIRSPLHSMLAYVELLLNETFGPLNDGQRNFLEKSMVLGDQTLDMLEDINEVYKSEQNVFSMDKESFQIANIIDQALLNLWIQADKKNIQIKKEIDPNLPLLTGDSFQIQRVFVNLIGNGIKYCPEHSTIIIRTIRTSTRLVELSVIDDGNGIPEQDLAKIFKKSFRVKKDEHAADSHGLGLYICKLIVKAHGGAIRAENNDIGGVSFIITLPVNDKI